MQGGAVATIVDAAAEAALGDATGETLVVTDMQLTYLALARVGPLRTRVEVLGARADALPPTSSSSTPEPDSRVTSIARVVATSSLRGDR